MIAQTRKKAIGTRSTLDTMKISLDMEVQIEISLRTKVHGGKGIYPKNHQKKNAFGTLNFGYKGNFITNGRQDQNIPLK